MDQAPQSTGQDPALQQAQQDYVKVSGAYGRRDPERKQLWEEWQEKWGDRFDAVCHEVFPLGGR